MGARAHLDRGHGRPSHGRSPGCHQGALTRGPVEDRVLATRPDGHRVRATLLESDPHNIAAARAAAADLPQVDVVRADAGDLAAYVESVPADLVLMAGVFGTSAMPTPSGRSRHCLSSAHQAPPSSGPAADALRT